VKQFVKDVTAFASALGMDQPGIVLSLAQIPWESDADRDDFIKSLLKEV
jgi:hypothetical protein